MNYVQMRTQALALLNRTDGTDALMQTFFQMGIQRCQRELRLPHMERVFVIDTSTAAVSDVPVPSDWLETIAFLATDANGIKLELGYVNIGDFQRLANRSFGEPTYYTRLFSDFQIIDPLPQNSVAKLYYYGEEGALVNDADVTTLSTIAPDLIIYAALTYAADYYIDDRSQAWEQKFQFFREQMQSQASEGENETGSNAIEPSAYYDDSVW